MRQVELRDVETSGEMRAVEQLQREVWGIPDLDVVPLSHLAAVKTAGGLLIGAFDGDDLAGFVYGFPAIEHGGLTHHSHMLAVAPEYRGLHIGERLKFAQYQRVLEQGIATISWTFDPLRSKNAHLNFRKLGVTCETYYVDFYGDDATSFLHQNGTDRLWVLWHVDEAGAGERVAGRPGPPSLDGVPLILECNDARPILHFLTGLSANRLVIEIPANIAAIEADDQALAREWRETARRAFETAIDAGYVVRDFVKGESSGRYLLVRND